MTVSQASAKVGAAPRVAALGDGARVLERLLPRPGEGDDGIAAEVDAGGPMASPVFNQGRNNTANPGEKSASAPGPEQAGIAVKSRRNPGQVFQESPSSAQESAHRWRRPPVRRRARGRTRH